MSKKSIIALKQTIQFFFFSVIVFLASSCEDDPQILGLNLIPDSDKVSAQYVDTFTVYAHTEKIDSVYSGYNQAVPLGNMHDPIFGFTKASLLTEFYPYGIDSIHDDNPVFDSVKLVLRPYRFHGDSLANMTINVYEYPNKLPGDSMLYSNIKVDKGNLTRIGQTHYQVKQEEIKIYLDDDFGQRLLSPPVHSFEEIIDSFELFNEVFPGIYLETEDVSNKGGIDYFRLSSVQEAFISLHYHYEDDTVTEFYTFYDLLGMHKNVSLFEHDYSNADFDPANASQTDSVVYIQSLAGTKAILKVPGLDNLVSPGDAVSVSSAKLLLPLEDFDKSKYVFVPSTYVGITAIESDNSESILVENSFYTTNQSGQITGYYTDGGIVQDSLYYELNITNHIESVFNNEKDNFGFNIFVANNYLQKSIQSLNRMVLTNHLNSNPIKLKVVYTKLSN